MIAKIDSVAETEFQDTTDSVVRALHDRVRWAALDGTELLRLLGQGLFAYGATNEESIARLLEPVYRRVMETVDTVDRFELYLAVKRRVEEGRASVSALLPFLLLEQQTAIVSTATVDLAMIGRSADGDELQWPRSIVSHLRRGAPTNRGAVLGGLVSLGDRRLHTELHDIKWRLPESEVNTAVRCGTGLPTVAAFEFWLTWSEELMEQGRGETALYGACVSALALLVKGMQAEFFADIERNFGYLHRSEESAPIAVLEQLSAREVAARSAQRLYALEAGEQSPKLMSRVLVHYGLEPRAAARERGVLG